MKLLVKVKPNSKVPLLEKTGPNSYVARIKAPAKEGKANDALAELLGDHFNVPKSRITILKGRASRDKVISIS